MTEQEAMVENIDQRGEEITQNVDKAQEELGEAVGKARSARRKKWWCLLIIRKCFPHSLTSVCFWTNFFCHMGSLFPTAICRSVG